MDYTTWFEYILQLLLDYSYSLLNGLHFFTFKQNLDYLKTTLIQNLTKKTRKIDIKIFYDMDLMLILIMWVTIFVINIMGININKRKRLII